MPRTRGAKNCSLDLKYRVPILFHEQGYNVGQIKDILGISKSLVYKCLDNYARFGVAHNPHTRQAGCRRMLSHIDAAYLRSLLSYRHTYYLDELQHMLLEQRGVNASISTIWRTIHRLRLSRKRTWRKAAERSELLRAAYWNRFATLVPDPNMLMFTDEAHKDDRTHDRLYGYTQIGVRCVQRATWVRGKRISILPVLTLDGIIAYDLVEGSVTSERFVRFIREQVLPFTNPYPGPRSVLVLDNCNIHHSEELQQIIEDAGCRLLYLPPYSPDFNPIEYAFAFVKAYLRRNWQDRTLTSIVNALRSITPEITEGWFVDAGYTW